jgi:acetoacetate decarboxylase
MMAPLQKTAIDHLLGFTYPLSPSGDVSLYGPPPWLFEGYAASALLAFDPGLVDGLLPDPLRLSGDPVCRVSVHDLICDYGNGEAFAQANPDLAHFHEAVVALMVEADGVRGQWCPFLWCDQDAEFAVGREFYGWPQKLASMSLTRPPLLRSWRQGDVVTGLVSRGHRSVFEIEIALERAGDVSLGDGRAAAFPQQSDAALHFTETIQTHPVDLSVTRRLISTTMDDVVVRNLWSGEAIFRALADELRFLEGAEPLGGRWHELAWKKPWGQNMIREGSAAL